MNYVWCRKARIEDRPSDTCAYGAVYYICSIMYVYDKKNFCARLSLQPILGSKGVLIPAKVAMTSTQRTLLHSGKDEDRRKYARPVPTI